MKRHGVIVQPYGSLGATFNPAVIKFHEGGYILMPRSVPVGYKKIGDINEFDGAYNSILSLWSGESPTEFKCINERAIVPGTDFDKYGCEDPRITKINDTYYIFYTALAKPLGTSDAADGIRIAMASTKDFQVFNKHGVIGPDRCSKAGVLFESASGLYFMWKDEKDIERMMISPAINGFEDPSKWAEFWQDRDVEQDILIQPQNNSHEGFGIEPGAPPLEIDEGLLVVYSSISLEHQWSISIMLLNKHDPTEIISTTKAPILSPREDYELMGDVNNVVFPCGACIDKNRLYIYYGGADKVCAVASEDLGALKKRLLPFKNNPLIEPA